MPTTSTSIQRDGDLGDSDEAGRLVYVSRDYYATMDSQLSVSCDDEVELVSDRDRYWWLVRDRNSGQTGYIPSDILETAAEREAKQNRQRNVEITQTCPTDREMPWRRPTPSAFAEDSADAAGSVSKLATWQMSGFARRGGQLRSAPAIEGHGSRHKKTVSFSEKKPVEHTIEAQSSDSSAAADEIAKEMEVLKMVDPEEGPLTSPTFRDTPIDPIVERLLEKEFGKPITSTDEAMGEFAEACPSAQPNSGPKYLDDYYDHHALSTHPTTTTTTNRKLAKPTKKINKLISKIWGKSSNSYPLAKLPDEQLLRIYAGNFTAVHGYKTLLVEEGTTMAEVADKACEKFGLSGDGFDYMLSVVHFDTHEILQVSANYTLATVIELAKRATIMEGQFAPETGKSFARLPRQARKRHEKRAKQFSNSSKSYAGTPATVSAMSPAVRTRTNSSFSCLASPVLQLASEDLTRDRESDFVTHYKFVLNRWLDGPAATAPFYVKVQILAGSSSRAPLLGGYSPDSPLVRNQSPSMMSKVGENNQMTIDFASAGDTGGGIVKMLINTSMSIAELLRAALISLNVSPHVPGIKYEIYLACKLGNIRDRIFLTKEMVVHDILHLKPMVDPSGLVLFLQPVIDSKVSAS